MAERLRGRSGRRAKGIPWGRGWRKLLAACLPAVFRPRLGVFEQYRPRPVRWVVPGRPPLLPEPAPTVSIVTPSFNQGEFLERTVRSVLEQDYPRLEYVVQDGGSSDQTPVVLERYRARLTGVDSRRDRGQAHAINRGFRRTTGEIMAYLNSDDVLLPGAVAVVAAYFTQNPGVDVVYGHRVVVDADDREIGRWALPPHDDAILSWADFVPQETLFWRRSIWDRAGGRMDEAFQFALDWDLLLRFRAAGARMVRLPRFLGAFRFHVGQKTREQLATVGAREMQLLRRRCLGRDVGEAEVGRRVAGYRLKHVLYQLLAELGLML